MILKLLTASLLIISILTIAYNRPASANETPDGQVISQLNKAGSDIKNNTLLNSSFIFQQKNLQNALH